MGTGILRQINGNLLRIKMLIIETYADLYLHIKEYPWLKVSKSNGLLSVNYCNFTHAASETHLPVFPNPYSLECRGIKFDVLTGQILARPFHKFFNLGEVPNDLSDRDITQAKVLEKLDGSMVYPLIHPISNDVRLCTKAGITDISVMAETLCDTPVGVLKAIILEGYTPIFEFTSPSQRIVIRYNDSSLSLLTVRNIITGEYVNDLNSFSKRLGIPIVTEYTNSLAIETVKKWEDKEGIVLVWDDGYRLKVKADEYIFRHKAKEGIRYEKNRIEIVLGDKLDDFKPLLDDITYEHLLEYRINLLSNIKSFGDYILSLMKDVNDKGLTKKEVAIEIVPNLKPMAKKYLFFMYDKPLSLEELILILHKDILTKLNSSTRVETTREVIGNDTYIY